MSRHIDADALIEEIERCSCETWSKGVNPTWWAQAVKVKDNIKQCIDRQPTADVVEVVRCKDCKYFYQDGDIKVCKHWNCHSTTDDSYCSYGERRNRDG